LRGKLCAAPDDCMAGFVCDMAVGFCVRPDSISSRAPDENGGGAGNAGSSGTNGLDAGSGSSPGGAGGGDLVGSAGSGGASAAGSSSSGSGGASGTSASGAGGAGANGSDAGSPNGCDPECGRGYRCVESSCVPASWTAMSPPPPEFVAREKAAYAVGGDKVLIWGGVDASGVNLSTGAVYDVLHDSWQLTSITTNTPSGRLLASAAWTGSQFLVWGGRTNSGSAEYKTGALYDPGTQEWTPVAAAGVARSGALSLSYSAQVLIWGGWSRDGAVLDKAARYAVAGNAWTNAANDTLGKREHVGWATSTTHLYVVGGRSDNGALLDSAAVYDMGSNGWTALPVLPAARYGAFALHDGTRLWVWGGRDDLQAMGSGLLLEATAWTPTASEDEPSPRWAPHRQSGWTCSLPDGRMALVGGHDISDAPQRDGGVYNPAGDSWDPIPSAGEAHEWGVGVCVDGELLLWGGSTNGTPTTSGERWAP
jgi:hypothetical protein